MTAYPPLSTLPIHIPRGCVVATVHCVGVVQCAVWCGENANVSPSCDPVTDPITRPNGYGNIMGENLMACTHTCDTHTCEPAWVSIPMSITKSGCMRLARPTDKWELSTGVAR